MSAAPVLAGMILAALAVPTTVDGVTLISAQRPVRGLACLAMGVILAGAAIALACL